MTTDVKRCEENGWRKCDRDAYECCMVCEGELCERCYKRLRMFMSDGLWPVCSKPSCRRLVQVREHYAENAVAL
jgi:hypothetical protein